ncbi:spore germination protein KC [Croceifilum oryzae]|uniref:Spore germination protein KC n=1 Tax=Croceifilum oryzae TaxID=1553429 RepID=A0AAJ1WRU9_9BACL|nr:Ger(x)C family spore germination protein [Croceifilum oryzae]MDQ0418902.1 spore germination protein KC [Croceifilum oryzae]
MKELKKGIMIMMTGILLCCTTGCWDKNELNELAIGELVGADRDPDTGKQTVYYQIVNPEAVAAQKGGGIKAPVYTYCVQADSTSELGTKTANLLPRKLFSDHYQSEIVTERYAKQGLNSLLNFFEKQHNRRSNLYLFVTDSPLSEVMMTYLPLERLPGRSLRSIIEIQSKLTGRLSRRVRIKDLVENMESSRLTVMPMISLSGSSPSPTTDRYEKIEANQGNLIFSGGAVFKNDRMIGKLPLNQMNYYFILKGESEVFMESLTINNRTVDVQAIKPKVRRRLDLISGEPVWKVDISTKLSLVNNEQKNELTLENLKMIEEKFKQQVFQKATEFYQESISKEWDLFGLEEKIKYQNGKEWDDMKKRGIAWDKTKLQLSIKSEITDIGQTINPYVGDNDGNSSN